MKRLMQSLRQAYWRWRLSRSGLPAIAGGAGGTIEGSRGTGNVAANILEVEFRDSVAELEPDSAPLTLLTAKFDKEATVNPKYTWFEDQLNQRFDAVNNVGGYASGATSIVVDTGSFVQADDLIFVPRTGELMRVTAVATNTLTVVRGVGSTAAAVLDDEPLINVSSAAQEGALDKPAKSKNPVEVFNYTQIERTPFDITGTMRSTQNRVTPHDWDRAQNHAGIEHAKNLEYIAMFGRPSIDTSGTHPRRTSGGFIHYATQNATDVGGTMTEQEFFNALSPIFRYGSKTKAAFCGRVPVDVIHTFPRSKLFIEQNENMFGISVVQVITPHGRINLVTHWLLEGAIYGGQIWIADMANLGQRYLHGADGSRDTKLREEIQAPGADGRKDEYLSEIGFEVRLPLTHGRITNITG